MAESLDLMGVLSADCALPRQAFMQPFSATQAALAEASQTAAEAAQQAMQNAYAQAFKAKLDITMKVGAGIRREMVWYREARWDLAR